MVVRCHAVYEGTKYPLLPPPLLPAHSAVLCSGTQPCFGLMELMQKPGSCWNNVIFSCFTFINMEHRLPGRYQLPAFVAAQTQHTAVAPACSPWHPGRACCSCSQAACSSRGCEQRSPVAPALSFAVIHPGDGSGKCSIRLCSIRMAEPRSPFHGSTAWLGWKGHRGPPCWHGAEASALQHGAHPQDLQPWKWLGHGWGLCAGLQPRPVHCVVICIRSQTSSERTRVMNEPLCEIPSPGPGVCSWFWW